MGLAQTENQLTWSASVTISVTAAGNSTSDSQAIAENAINGAIYVKSDNAGTPASGDELTIKILYSGGDPDADPDSTDEYETSANAAVSGVIDTNLEDPGLIKIPVDTAAIGFELYVENAGASAMTVSAQYVEQTAT